MEADSRKHGREGGGEGGRGGASTGAFWSTPLLLIVYLVPVVPRNHKQQYLVDTKIHPYEVRMALLSCACVMHGHVSYTWYTVYGIYSFAFVIANVERCHSSRSAVEESRVEGDIQSLQNTHFVHTTSATPKFFCFFVFTHVSPSLQRRRCAPDDPPHPRPRPTRLPLLLVHSNLLIAPSGGTPAPAPCVPSRKYH